MCMYTYIYKYTHIWMGSGFPIRRGARPAARGPHGRGIPNIYVYMYIYLSIYLSICLSIYIYLSIYISQPFLRTHSDDVPSLKTRERILQLRCVPSVQFSIWAQRFWSIVKRFRGGLVLKAHRRLHQLTLGSRVMKKKDAEIHRNAVEQSERIWRG